MSKPNFIPNFTFEIENELLYTNEIWFVPGYQGGQVCVERIYHPINEINVEGCMDDSYLNYNPVATIDDGSCSNNICNYQQNREKPHLNKFNLFK